MLARRPESPGARGAGTLRALAGVVLAGLVLGTAVTEALRTGGEWMAPAPAEASTDMAKAPMVPGVQVKASARQPARTSAAAAAKPTVASTAKAPVVAPSKASTVASANGATTKAPPQAMSPIVAASARPTTVTVKSAPSVSGPKPATHIEEQFTYQYNALGRRDPFQPLIGGAFVGDDIGGDAPADVGGIKVVGIVWGTDDKFALVEDARGNSLVLRQGDKVMNGYVQSLKRDAVLVQLTADGQTQSVTIPLTRKGDNSNANR